MTMERDTLISYEGLLYLFADRIIQKSSLTRRLLSHPAAPVPGRQTLVELDQLETMIFAWAFWGLQRESQMGLELAERPSGLRAAKDQMTGTGWKPSRVRITTVELAHAGESLSAGLATSVPAEGAGLVSTIIEWAASHAPLPVFGIVQIVRTEAIGLGILQHGLEQPSWRQNRAFNRVLAASRPNGDSISRLREIREDPVSVD